jgi:Tfp pilus assembly protein PilZ
MALPVRFRRDRSGATLEHAGVTHDVSIAGAFIETDSPLPVGERVRIFLASPSAWEPLEVRAEVRWVKDGDDGEPSGLGVCFDALSAEDAGALYALIHASDYTP